MGGQAYRSCLAHRGGAARSEWQARVYAAGNSTIWYSPDGGSTWVQDAGVSAITSARQSLNDFRKKLATRMIRELAGSPGPSAMLPGQRVKSWLSSRKPGKGVSRYRRRREWAKLLCVG